LIEQYGDDVRARRRGPSWTIASGGVSGLPQAS